MVKITLYKKKRFCQVDIAQFNRKFDSNLFSLLNFYFMSTRSKVMVDFVLSWLELRSELGNIWIKEIKNG